MTVGSFCPSCGAVIRPAALYCSSCGAAAASSAGAPPVPPPSTVGSVGLPVGGGQPVGGPGAGVAGPHPHDVPGAGTTVVYPPFGRRVGAFVIDTVPVLLVAALLWAFWPADPTTLSWLLLGSASIIVVLAAAAVLAVRGRSPGSAVWGLRVIREQSGAAPGAMGVGRLALKYLLLVGTLLVAGFSPLWDGERRGRAWWDKIVGTVVVNVVRAPPGPDEQVSPAANIPAWDIPVSSARNSGTRITAARSAGSQAVWSDRPASSSEVPATSHQASTGTPAPAEFDQQELRGQPAAAISPPPVEHQWSGPPTPQSALITGVPGRPAPRVVEFANPLADSTSIVDATEVPDPNIDRSSADAAVDHTRMATREPAPDLSREHAPDPGWQLTFDDGRTLPLDGPLIVGRNPSVAPDETGAAVLALVDENRSVSKTHLRIDVGESGVLVTDRHSTNGVSVRTGSATSHCVPGVPTPIPDGSTVQFGDREFAVRRR